MCQIITKYECRHSTQDERPCVQQPKKKGLFQRLMTSSSDCTTRPGLRHRLGLCHYCEIKRQEKQEREDIRVVASQRQYTENQERRADEQRLLRERYAFSCSSCLTERRSPGERERSVNGGLCCARGMSEWETRKGPITRHVYHAQDAYMAPPTIIEQQGPSRPSVSNTQDAYMTPAAIADQQDPIRSYVYHVQVTPMPRGAVTAKQGSTSAYEVQVHNTPPRAVTRKPSPCPAHSINPEEYHVPAVKRSESTQRARRDATRAALTYGWAHDAEGAQPIKAGTVWEQMEEHTHTVHGMYAPKPQAPTRPLPIRPLCGGRQNRQSKFPILSANAVAPKPQHRIRRKPISINTRSVTRLRPLSTDSVSPLSSRAPGRPFDTNISPVSPVSSCSERSCSPVSSNDTEMDHSAWNISHLDLGGGRQPQQQQQQQLRSVISKLDNSVDEAEKEWLELDLRGTGKRHGEIQVRELQTQQRGRHIR